MSGGLKAGSVTPLTDALMQKDAAGMDGEALVAELMASHRKLEEKLSGLQAKLPAAPKEKLPVREAARRRMPLDGADAQALEGALQQVECELETEKASANNAKAVINQVEWLCYDALGVDPEVNPKCEEATFTVQELVKRVIETSQKELAIVTADRNGLMRINARHRERIQRLKALSDWIAFQTRNPEGGVLSAEEIASSDNVTDLITSLIQRNESAREQDIQDITDLLGSERDALIRAINESILAHQVEGPETLERLMSAAKKVGIVLDRLEVSPTKVDDERDSR